MEEWQKAVVTGIILIILAAVFSALQHNLSIWMIIVIILGVVDIAVGLYRKKMT